MDWFRKSVEPSQGQWAYEMERTFFWPSLAQLIFQEHIRIRYKRQGPRHWIKRVLLHPHCFLFLRFSHWTCLWLLCIHVFKYYGIILFVLISLSYWYINKMKTNYIFRYNNIKIIFVYNMTRRAPQVNGNLLPNENWSKVISQAFLVVIIIWVLLWVDF